jgi:multiple sugar transport system permease protein
LVFWFYPLLYSFYLSFTEYHTLTNTTKWIGIDNYKNILDDEIFWKAIKNTFAFTFVTVPITTILSILMANMLNSKFVKFKSFFRAAYFLPSVTSLIVISLIFTNMYAKAGYVNLIFQTLGLPISERGFLLDVDTALPAIMAMDIWMSTGYYMVLFLAGMQTIPDDLYESAELAGASKKYQFINITLPLLKPTILFVLLINTIKSFQVFVEIYVMTKGGPLDSTSTLVYLIFKNAFQEVDLMGYASAIAYILFIILIIFSFLQNYLLKERD